MTGPPDDVTTDPQSVIAALRQQLDVALAEKSALVEALTARTGELATRNSEFGERIEHQAATIGVLKAMSASPGDPQPVFDLIAERVRAVCGKGHSAVAEFDGTLLHLRANSGNSEETSRAFEARYPQPLSPNFMLGRPIVTRDVVLVDDLWADPEYALPALARAAGWRSVMSVPILRAGMPIGAIAHARSTPGIFRTAEVELLRIFAEQAAIAITSAETYRELQARTAALAARNSEYGEQIEQQAATIDVLQEMSASPGDAQPVFQLIVDRARDFCGADQASVGLVDGDLLYLKAHRMPVELAAHYEAQFPRPVNMESMFGRAILTGNPVQTPDVSLDPDHFSRDRVGGPQFRAIIAVPLLREGKPIGAIALGRCEPGEYSAIQTELLQTFAKQAVITIGSAETYRALQTRTSDLQESLEYQTATSDVLKVIGRSAFALQPVLAMLAETAATLCVADRAAIFSFEGGMVRLAASVGFPPEYQADFDARGLTRLAPDSPGVLPKAARERRVVHVHDAAAVPGYSEAAIKLGNVRTALGVPLLRESEPIGVMVLSRQRVDPFTDRQIELVSTFADQAVIAIENTRLITETREALEQQTATAEVLQVINASPGNLTPVFDAMLEKAIRLCEAEFGILRTWDEERLHLVAARGDPQLIEWTRRRGPFRPDDGDDSPLGRIVSGEQVVHSADALAEGAYQTSAGFRAMVDATGFRSGVTLALRKDAALLGTVTVYRIGEVRPFTDKQVALLQNFAAQAVIAMENARLLNEIRQRQAELRVTFDNMADGVVMFDGDLRLAAWNRNLQELLDLPDAVLSERRSYAEYLHILAERGEFGDEAIEAELGRRLEHTDQGLPLERSRPDGRVIEVRRNAVPDGGFVLIYSDITERKRSEAEIRAARDAAEAAYRDLKAAQASLIQAEKMASLGQLTAGIAHEIKNPLNFVNNFASLSVELLDELKETAASAFATLEVDQRANIEDISATLTTNLEKIVEHGQRADGIVRGMLEHSRGTSGGRRMVDLNTLVDDALNLAYHGARAQDQSFNISLERDFATGIAPIELTPQDVTRVLLNLFGNAFYATRKRAKSASEPDFQPTLKAITRNLGDTVEIRVWDNGTGIPADIKDKLFQPFFTTKPTGEGTGLGLSITYDIVTKQHSGTISVESEEGAYTEFTVTIPRVAGLALG